MNTQLIKNKPKTTVWLVFFIISFLFLLGIYIGLRFGAISYNHKELLAVLSQPFHESKHQDIIIDIRLPRLLAAILVGAAMSQAGAIMQGITRNPIADPGLLGINAGAGLALVIAYAFLEHLHYSLILLVCLLGSAVATVLVFTLAYHRKQGYHQIRLILAGAMVTTLFTAIGQAITISFDLSTAIIGWQSGGLITVNWKMLAIVTPILILGMVLAQLFSHQLTILSLNETVATALGQKTFIMTLLLLGVVLLLSASAVAIVGSISFIGLIIPHLVRLTCRRNYRLILPLSAFMGATFMLWVDIACRTINPPYETPLNAIISLIGLPCFLILMKRGQHL